MTSFLLGGLAYAALQSGVVFSVLEFFLPREYMSMLLFVHALGTIVLRTVRRKLWELKDSCCSVRKQKVDDDEDFLFPNETKTTAATSDSNIAAIPTMRKPRVLKEEEQNMDTTE